MVLFGIMAAHLEHRHWNSGSLQLLYPIAQTAAGSNSLKVICPLDMISLVFEMMKLQSEVSSNCSSGKPGSHSDFSSSLYERCELIGNFTKPMKISFSLQFFFIVETSGRKVGAGCCSHFAQARSKVVEHCQSWLSSFGTFVWELKRRTCWAQESSSRSLCFLGEDSFTVSLAFSFKPLVSVALVDFLIYYVKYKAGRQAGNSCY